MADHSLWKSSSDIKTLPSASYAEWRLAHHREYQRNYMREYMRKRREAQRAAKLDRPAE